MQICIIAHCSVCNFQNGFWFGTGWALLFFVPVIVVAVKLSRHYRKMDECEGYGDDEDDEDDYDDYGRLVMSPVKYQ